MVKIYYINAYKQLTHQEQKSRIYTEYCEKTGINLYSTLIN